MTTPMHEKHGLAAQRSTLRPAARFHVDQPLQSGDEIALSEGQAHQLRAVLRAIPGADLLLFNGRDGEWHAVLSDLRKSSATATLRRQTRPQQDTRGPTLCFAPIKKARLDLLIEKATELGVGALQPVLTRRTQTQRVSLDRLQAQAIEAAEQCERLDVPSIATPMPFDALLATWPPDRPLWVCVERSGAPWPTRDRPATIARLGLLVGPEGGLAPEELDAIREKEFCRAIGLGPRVLRAETAALAALVLAQAM